MRFQAPGLRGVVIGLAFVALAAVLVFGARRSR